MRSVDGELPASIGKQSILHWNEDIKTGGHDTRLDRK
jgi:hypothetical protein